MKTMCVSNQRDRITTGQQEVEIANFTGFGISSCFNRV